MKHGFPSCSRSRRNERGVALIIVLGFLGLMVMMAVAFMVQARVERMVADASLEGMRARQVAQTGIAAAIQDYMNALKSLKSQSDSKYDMFLSGDLDVSASYHYSGDYYDSTNLWNGESADWLPAALKGSDSKVDLDDVEDMEWIWVREEPGKRSRILGRYAYACFNLSGGVDANLLGRVFGQEMPDNGYGAQTNRNNVRKMLVNGVRATPSTDTEQQYRLAQYQEIWQGLDTPAALNKLTDGAPNGGGNNSRWDPLNMNESDVGMLAKDYLSCYSYAATHRGKSYAEKKKCSVDAITDNHYFKRLVTDMGGNATDVRKALEDYFSSSPIPQGTDYPSVKDVPMFNEIKVEVQLKQKEGSDKWQLKVTLKPEFWCPFPSDDNKNGNYLLMPPTMGGGAMQTGGADIWIRALGTTAAGIFQPQITQESVEPAGGMQVEKSKEPKSPGEFVYTLNLDGMPVGDDGSVPEIKQLRIAGVIFQKPWELTYGGSSPVDSTPEKGFSLAVSPNTLTHSSGVTTGTGYVEVDDPRLNHETGRWAASSDGSMGKTNSCLAQAKAQAKAKMGYEPGAYMYCRNGQMQTPAELGYIPVYNGSTPWMTLDIFSENGVELMNTLVCDEAEWKILDAYDVYYTNGTINPYTRNAAVYNGAFYGLDIREVPGMAGKPEATTEYIGADRAKQLSEQLVKEKDPDGNAFIKAGPGGWTRVLRYKGFDFNKNERVALARNTWGLFNESDTLFLVFVVAQSISEAPAKVDPVGNWSEKDDMITGERWAVALCWMDTSAEGAADDLTQEMDIIMFKYLND